MRSSARASRTRNAANSRPIRRSTSRDRATLSVSVRTALASWGRSLAPWSRWRRWCLSPLSCRSFPRRWPCRRRASPRWCRSRRSPRSVPVAPVAPVAPAAGPLRRRLAAGGGRAQRVVGAGSALTLSAIAPQRLQLVALRGRGAIVEAGPDAQVVHLGRLGHHQSERLRPLPGCARSCEAARRFRAARRSGCGARWRPSSHGRRWRSASAARRSAPPADQQEPEHADPGAAADEAVEEAGVRQPTPHLECAPAEARERRQGTELRQPPRDRRSGSRNRARRATGPETRRWTRGAARRPLPRGCPRERGGEVPVGASALSSSRSFTAARSLPDRARGLPAISPALGRDRRAG